MPRGLFLTFMVIGGLGAVLTAAYFLVMLSRVTHGLPERAVPAAVARSDALGSGPPGSGATGSGSPGSREAGRRVLRDIQGYEWAAWVPLIVLILLFGLWPKLLLSLTTPAVQTLLGALS